jgi:hypothetical protein
MKIRPRWFIAILVFRLIIYNSENAGFLYIIYLFSYVFLVISVIISVRKKTYALVYLPCNLCRLFKNRQYLFSPNDVSKFKILWYAAIRTGRNILSCDWVTIGEVWIGNRIYWILKHTTRDYSLLITISHRLVLWVTVFTVLLANISQHWTFLCCWAACHVTPDFYSSDCHLRILS